MKLTADKLTIAKLEGLVGPAAKWHGRCFEIATAAAKLLGQDAVAVYGHYLGYVDPDGFWGNRCRAPFIHHGWVRLDGGRILDPTRWSFENLTPYIYLEDQNDDLDYDEGGNQWRRANMRPAPKAGKANRTVRFVINDPAVRAMVLTLLGPEEVLTRKYGLDLTAEQAFWLANAPYDAFGPHAFAVYREICLSHSSGAIPIDNQRRAERDAGKPLPKRRRKP